MKKLLVILFVSCLLLNGCSKQNNNGNGGSVWDHEEYQTIEEMNAAAKTNIVSAAISGKENESYIVISGNIAQYKFTANGIDWCIRASTDVENDISGLNYESISFEKDIEATYYTDEVYAHRFFHENVQYIIFADIKDKDISMKQFDDISAEFQTNITGIKAGYENEVYEDGDNVVYKVIMYNSDATTIIMEYIYAFEEDKMVSITSNVIFDTADLAKEYYDELANNGANLDNVVLNDNTITSVNTTDLDFYSDMTKADFLAMMKSSIE